MSLLRSTQQYAERFGLNLLGLVDAKRFDVCQPPERRSTSLQPGCGTIVVLATAGRSFRQGFLQEHMPRLAPSRQGNLMAAPPLDMQQSNGFGAMVPRQVAQHAADQLAAAVDEIAMSGVQEVARKLSEQGHEARLVDARQPALHFGQLAEAAGFGIVSPVSGLLLHPEFGPWIRVRAALLLAGNPFGELADASIAERFRPCCTCDRPCVTACPTTAHDGLGHTDPQQCGSHRQVGGCESGCHSRLACPIGSEHRDQDAIPVHAHSASLRTVQKWFGFGVWRIVPRIFRRLPRP